MCLNVFVAERVIAHQAKTKDPVFYDAIAATAGIVVGLALFLRLRFVRSAAERLQRNRDDQAALASWRKGVIVPDVLSGSVFLASRSGLSVPPCFGRFRFTRLPSP